MNKASEAARWSFSLGYTLNVGNFQSLRIDIGLQDSALPGENAEQAYDRIVNAVSSKFLERINEERAVLEREGLA